jgi:hypothetical protein
MEKRDRRGLLILGEKTAEEKTERGLDRRAPWLHQITNQDELARKIIVPLVCASAF